MKPIVVQFSTEEEEGDRGVRQVPRDPERGAVGVVKEVGQKTMLEQPLTVYIDGPFGSPSSNIYRQFIFGRYFPLNSHEEKESTTYHRWLRTKQGLFVIERLLMCQLMEAGGDVGVKV